MPRKPSRPKLHRARKPVRAIEPLLRTPEILALRKAGGPTPLSTCLEDVDSVAGRRRVVEHLRKRPFPRYEQQDGHLVRIDKDGTRTPGRFVNRRFQPLRKRSIALITDTPKPLIGSGAAIRPLSR